MKMDENGMSDSQARNSLSNTPTHHVWSLIERVMEKQRCETIRHNFFFFCIILKKSGVVVLAKKKMNKRKPPPPPRQAQKRTSRKKRKAQTTKAKGGKAAASSGEREEQETKGTSAVISRSNPLFFFPFVGSCRRTMHSRIIICLIVVRFQRALDLRYRLALDTSLRALERFSREFRSSVRSTRNGRSHERTHESQRARTRENARETLFFTFSNFFL